MDMKLGGRVALVTGSSQGIGRAVALQLGAEGARVAVTYHQHREKAEAVVAEIARTGSEAIALPLHLGDSGSIHGAVRAVIERFGQVDILVNNAVEWSARLPWAMPRFEEVPEEEWRSTIRSNVEGAYAAVQAVVPSMRARGWGRIVSVSSGVALDGVPGASAYGAAKAALHGMTSSLARELGPAGILVNVVVPGLTLLSRLETALPAAVREQRAKAYPIGRLLPPEEVAPTIVFLCSGANTAVTGEIVRASGGRPS